MIYSLGDFKFTTKTNINSLSRSLDSGISFQDRISNHACAVAAKKWEETISIEGETLPVKVGIKALEGLFKIAKSQQPCRLISGQMEEFGKYVITSLREGREAFDNRGRFFKQSFNVELRRVGDA